ncbi:MAG: NADH-quinone oxidoreductase subunit N [Gemmatimonadetes bacterium]|uniref:NADH-quinone oxidoreductase subunit N n=1 Tax=Candidatus Kutchimonas denitrificans TaxID=3056748 RepID=A0AAE4Z7J4_9BACT|nr:NADH-quinone oxidoreductase subunit N [Gemmatimonadota bacterium]NIR75219.1 NADH-quinone oxidoreductase subunit N [Candidatus Kutchimonas denitrificans]NIS00157.1 NADH-quinone oxidoreductase subunit N [Gemmatimonadota bacterium]NIT65749.1 NADH-quinone oxidoreductase subunit N [Gemmatimonadota bacterium]NIU53027.1 NADH-quinone oxidoreductase subunit NuoN [Gemmatimonadota bacterium]
MHLEFTSQLDYLWALMPEAVLATGALILLLYDGFFGGDSSDNRAVGWGSMVIIALAAVANVWLMGVEEVGDTGMVALDGFRTFTNFIFLAAGALIVLISFDYNRREDIKDAEYYALLLFALVGMMILAGSRDLILIFLGFELMSLAVYVLVGFNRKDPRSSEASLKYFLLGAFASAFLLYGMALLVGSAGTTNIGLMGVMLNAESAELLTVMALALLAIGFGFKVSAVPFHVWTPDAYEGAPTPVTAFLGAAIKGAAFAAFIRIFVLGLGDFHAQWEAIIWWFAALTMIVPNLIALVQNNIKRLLAYSSIAHAGYLLVALIAANTSGMASFLFYLIAYTAMIVGAFAIVLVLAGRGDRYQQLSDYDGLGWSRPWAAALLALFLVSLAGLPPTAGFVGKFYILRAAVEAGYLNLAILLVLTTLVSYWYYLRVIVNMYMKPSAEAREGVAWAASLRTVLAVCAIITVLMGIFPSWPLLKARQSVAGLRQATEQVVETDPLTRR